MEAFHLICDRKEKVDQELIKKLIEHKCDLNKSSFSNLQTPFDALLKRTPKIEIEFLKYLIEKKVSFFSFSLFFLIWALFRLFERQI